MSTVAAPIGLRPVGYIGGRPFAGATNEYRILSGYGTSIFHGDIVRIGGSADTTAEGYLVKDTGTTTLTKPIGVFMGCRYTESTTGQIVYREYFPASTAASDIYAFVADDPNTVFQLQSDEAVAQSKLGLNFALVQGSGSTTTGQSAVALDGSTLATTNTLPMRVIGFQIGPNSAIGDTYTDCLVTYNAGFHAYSNATGR